MAKTRSNNPRVRLPEIVSAGEVFEIKTLLKHPMESGHRKDKEGNSIPRKIINKFICEFNDGVVFSADIKTGVAANPYFAFKAKIYESGTFTFFWTDDDGTVTETEQAIKVI